MKIIFFEIRDNERKTLESLLVGHELEFYSENLDKQTVAHAADADIVSVFVGSEAKKEIIDAMPNVKLLVTRSTGFDHIDIAYAKQKNIIVASVPAYGSHTVAEFAFGLMLAVSRNIAIANEKMRTGDGYKIAGFQGFDLFGKTLGVIGTGKIGKNVVTIARGFGMQVFASDPYPDQVFAESVGMEYVPLSVLLANSDVVTLHAPYNESTKHLLNADNIPQMKLGAILINSARGELVDTAALVAGLRSGHIAGAGLDVLECEHMFKEEKTAIDSGVATAEDLRILADNHFLVNSESVVVTPHIAFFSREAEMEIIKTTTDNILSFVDGTPKNVVGI